TPPSNGSVTSTLTVSTSGATPLATTSFQAIGVGGGLTRSATMSLSVTAPPDYVVVCNATTLSSSPGGSASTLCTVGSRRGPDPGPDTDRLLRQLRDRHGLGDQSGGHGHRDPRPLGARPARAVHRRRHHLAERHHAQRRERPRDTGQHERLERGHRRGSDFHPVTADRAPERR